MVAHANVSPYPAAAAAMEALVVASGDEPLPWEAAVNLQPRSAWLAQTMDLGPGPLRPYKLARFPAWICITFQAPRHPARIAWRHGLYCITARQTPRVRVLATYRVPAAPVAYKGGPSYAYVRSDVRA